MLTSVQLKGGGTFFFFFIVTGQIMISLLSRFIDALEQVIFNMHDAANSS